MGKGSSVIGSFFQRITRKKALERSGNLETALHRCYGTVDLTLLGIGSMVGSGIYVVVGTATRDQAGPGIVLSFLVAAGVVALAAVCFTEFATRISKTGGTYLYTYCSLGEIWAFLVGWGLLCTSVASAATNAKAWSGYLDSLFDHQIRNLTETYVAHWTVGKPIGSHPDFVALGVICILMVVVSLGAQCTARFNHIFAGLNVLVLMFVTITGLAHANISNWTSNSTGGFLPYGVKGVLAGSASAYWAMTGFESISVANEETKDPLKSIPCATAAALTTVTLLYIGTSSSLTLMTSYKNVEVRAPLPGAFADINLTWAQYIVAIGPLFGFTTTLLGTVYSYTRLSYTISHHGLLPQFLGKLNSRTKVPVNAVLIGGSVMALIAVFLDIRDTIDFAVNLTLLQYLLIASCVLVLRYQPSDSHLLDLPGFLDNSMKRDSDGKCDSEEEVVLLDVPGALKGIHKDPDTTQLANSSNNKTNSTSELMPSKAPQGEDNALFSSDDEQSGLSRHRHPSTSSDILTNVHEDEVGRNNKPRSHSPTEDLIFRSSTALQVPSGHTLNSALNAGQLKDTFRCLQPVSIPPAGCCVKISIVLSIVCMTLLLLVVVFAHVQLAQGAWWLIATVVILIILIIIQGFMIWTHRQNIYKLKFKVPCVPVLPLLSMFSVLVLMVNSGSVSSWVGCLTIMLIGTVVYFTYSLHHSVENHVFREEIQLEERALLLDQE